MLPQFEFGLGSLERLRGGGWQPGQGAFMALLGGRFGNALRWDGFKGLFGHNAGGCADVAPREFRGLGVTSRLRGLGRVGF